MGTRAQFGPKKFIFTAKNITLWEANIWPLSVLPMNCSNLEGKVNVLLTWQVIKDLIGNEIEEMRQDLKHLVYPLNHSSNTQNLVKRQELFVDLYDADWEKWKHVVIQSRLPISSELNTLAIEESTSKIEVLRQLLIIFMNEFGYDSRTRTLLLRLSRKLEISSETFVSEVENVVLEGIDKELNQIQRSLSSNEDSETTQNEAIAKTAWSRKKWMYATVGVFVGAAACSLTAGLAAPIFIPAILSAAGITGAAFITGTGGVAIMATLFGIAGAGMASYRVSRRFSDLKDFIFIPLKDVDRNRSLRVCITISGWIKSESDFTAPWIESYLENEDLDYSIQSEVYCLAFEKDIMISLGRSMQDFIKASAVTLAASEFIKYTVTAAASSALLFPVAILQAGDLVDNPWTLGLDRARKAGKALAEALKRGAQGRRPVTLVGYSLGALVIFTCLQELARGALNDDNSTDSVIDEELNTVNTSLSDFSLSTDDPMSLDVSESSSNNSTVVDKTISPFGIIENVLLMGLPTHLPAPSVWSQLRLLVSGRFIHCYSKSDWVLKFLYRTSSPTASGIAGLGPIEDSPTIENVDLSDLVLGHSEYQMKLAEIMGLVHL